MQRDSAISKLPPKLARAIKPVLQAAKRSTTLPSKFWMDGYLIAVYRLYRRWTLREITEKKTRQLASWQNIKVTKRTHPLRIIIAATSPVADGKIQGRWTRALEFAAFREIETADLGFFIRKNGGLSGCARAMAKCEPKRRENPFPTASVGAQQTFGQLRDDQDDENDDGWSGTSKRLNKTRTLQGSNDWIRPKHRMRRSTEIRDLSWGSQESKRVPKDTW